MQAELRLSVGEHSLLDTYCVFTNGGSSLERGTSRNLAAGPQILSRRCIARASHHLLTHRAVPWALGSGAWEPWLMKRKMGVFARNLLYWFWILRIRRLHASAEGELITVKLSSS